MAYYPFAPEIGAFYQLTGPDGTIITFNDKNDTNFCGTLTDITGLDSADVRDSGDVLVQADGGYTGTNWFGRRPITMTGTMYGYTDAIGRATQMAKIRAATNAMDADGAMYITGTPPGAPLIYANYRRQQPTRFSGGWIKTFNISIVSTTAPLLSLSTTTPSYLASTTIENLGDYAKYPPSQINVQGSTSSPLVITNTTTGGVIRFLAGFTLGAGQFISVFPQTHQAFNASSGLWITSQIDFVNSTWFGLKKGNNTITTSSGTAQIIYNSAWV